MARKVSIKDVKKMQEAERLRRKHMEEGFEAGKKEGMRQIREQFRELMHLAMGSNADYWP